MGKLLEAVRRFRMNVKLNRGRCEECGTILPDVHPVKGERACSEECATQLWASRLS
jgi:hypothetical protein